MTAEFLLNAWIDANLMLGAFLILWLAASRLMSASGLDAAVIGQARALEWLCLVLVAAPFLSRGLAGVDMAAVPNVSDMLVAHYLHGNLDVSAGDFEAMLGIREDLVASFLAQQSPWAVALLAGLSVGAAYHAGTLLLGWVRLRGLVKRAHVWRRFGRLQLVVSSEVRVPFSTCGLRNRYVVLPSDLLGNDRDIHFALAHEFQHLRRHDLAFEVAIEALRPLFFWNPAFRILCRQLRDLRELSCDQAIAIRRPASLRGYCNSLIRASERARSPETVFVPAAPVVAFVGAGSGSALDSRLGRRILALTEGPPSTIGHSGWKLVCLALCAALLVGAVVMRAPSGWSHDRIMLSTIVNLERLNERNAILARTGSATGGMVMAEALD